MIYLDTSAVLPYYREEPLSGTVQSLLADPKRPVLITELTKLEVASCLARWVRMGDLPEADATAIEVAFAEDIEAGSYTLRSLESRHYRKAEEWLLARTTVLRTLDALHLAFAAINGSRIVTADVQMANAAETLGVRCKLLTVT